MKSKESLEENNQIIEAPKFYPTVKQSIFLMLLLLLLTIVASIPYVVIALAPDVFDGPIYLSLGFLIAYVGSFLWTIQIAKRRIAKEGLWTHKWQIKKVPLILNVLAVIVTFALIILIDFISSLIPMSESIKAMFHNLLRTDVFSFLTVVIAAPILEEMLFRGIVLQGFLKNYTPRQSIIWSSLLFGLIHLNPWQAIGATIMGMFIGWMCVKTKSLIPGIIIHFATNLSGFLFVAFTNKGEESWLDFGSGPVVNGITLILAVTIVLIGLKNLSNKFEGKEQV